MTLETSFSENKNERIKACFLKINLMFAPRAKLKHQITVAIFTYLSGFTKELPFTFRINTSCNAILLISESSCEQKTWDCHSCKLRFVFVAVIVAVAE